MATQDTQDWIEAYKELCTHIETKVTEIKHIDLDHDQLLFEQEEYPFPETALFIDFSTEKIETMGLNVQDIDMLVKFTFAFDTLSDTYSKSENQSTALAFGAILRKLHKNLQALSGVNFSSMNRIAFRRERAPDGCIAYSQIYSCKIIDYSALAETTTGDLQAANVTIDLSNGTPPVPPDVALFVVDM